MRFLPLVLSLLLPLGSVGCDNSNPTKPPVSSSATAATRPLKRGVLLVSHGSPSPNWRQMLEELGAETEARVTALDHIAGMKSAFMEYTEPSIATQLKAFDNEGYDEVLLMPLLLTVSTHSFDDIPVIIGQKHDAATLETLKGEKIECYTPKARVTIAPLLEYPAVLEENVPRRIRALSKDPNKEGVVLVAYGSGPYNEEWDAFFKRIGEVVRRKTGVSAVSHAWCGDMVRYSREPTKQAIADILKSHERAIVIPVLVAVDETFQINLIGKAVAEMNLPDRIAYVPDSILPEPRIAEWIVAAAERAKASPSSQAPTADAAGGQP